jgi:hypothetical protein
LKEEFIQSINKKLHKNKAIGFMRHFVQKLTGFRISIPTVKSQITNIEILKLIKKIICGLKLLYLSMIFQVHSNSPRYPNGEDDMNYFLYTPNHSIVKYLPNIINETKKLIQEFEAVYILTSKFNPINAKKVDLDSRNKILSSA